MPEPQGSPGSVAWMPILDTTFSTIGWVNVRSGLGSGNSATPFPVRRLILAGSRHVDRHHRRPPVARRDGCRLPPQAATRGARLGHCSRRRTRRCPSWWGELVELGWLGLHVPEAHGGSGYGLEELVVVVEELGRAVAPGPFVPTVIASAVLAAVGGDGRRRAAARSRRRLGDGRGRARGISHGRRRNGVGHRRRVLGGGLADVLLVAVGDDVAVVEARRRRDGRRAAEPRPDPSRPRASRSTARRPPCSPARGACSSTSPACSSRPRPSASRASAPRWRPRTRRSACSSDARSRCSRPSSTTAPTWSSPPSSRRARCGTPRGPPPPAATSSRTRPRSRRRSRLPRPTSAPT